MAGKRKAEGIALLSVYNDEDMDDVDDDDDENEEEEMAEASPSGQQQESLQQQQQQQQPQPQPEEDKQPQPQLQLQSQLQAQSQSQPQSPSPMAASAKPMDEDESLQQRQGEAGTALGIVDYAHDEMAVSPESQQGEVLHDSQSHDGVLSGNNSTQERTPATVHVSFSEKNVTCQSGSMEAVVSKHENEMQSNNVDIIKERLLMKLPEQNGAVNIDSVEQEDDPLADFLPPPSIHKCPDELQSKINKYLALKSSGRSFNDELRNSKGYRNPDFLQRAVKYQEIDQIGSCFRKEVFDPHGYDPSDYYDVLALELKREFERREQEKKKSQKVEFVHGGVQPAGIQPALNPAQTVAAQKALGSISANVNAPVNLANENSKSDSRLNKKSKWDKVDGDKRNPLPSGAKDAMVAANAHAVVSLTAVNVGAGYSAFAQQKRKEAEEKKLTEKRSIK